MNPQPVEPELDMTRLTEWAGGDTERLVHIVKLFGDTLTASLTRLRQSIAQSDLAQARRASHELKNCFLLVDAQPALTLAESVERLDAAATMSEASALLLQLEVSTAAVLTSMQMRGSGA